MTREIIVAKIGGAEGNENAGLLADLARRHDGERAVLVVHGGSGETDRLMAALGREPRTLVSPSGHVSRMTDRATLEVFCQATALVNRRLVEAARGAGIDAFGISGLDGGLVRARRKDSVRAVVGGRQRVVRDQWTGRITGVRAELMESLLRSGMIPFVAPLACGENGEMLNVDGDRLAAALAAALGASALVLLTNVDGLRADAEDASSVIDVVDSSELERARACARGRMLRKVLAAEEALTAGVPRVVISSSAGPQPLEAALAGSGTTFVQRAGAGTSA